MPSTTPGGFSTVSINVDKGLYFKIKVDNPNEFNDLTSTDHVYSGGTSLPPFMIANQQYRIKNIPID